MSYLKNNHAFNARKNTKRDKCELSKKEQQRLAKLEGLLDRLIREKNVQNRQLATWMTDDEYESYESEWESQKKIREELKEKPNELKRYEDKLKQAIFNYSRAEGYSTKGNHITAKKFHNKSESFCEEALEILQELVHSDASIQQWFDRALDFDAGGDLGLTPVAMPRVITSRSLDKQSADMRVMSKREVKISIVEMAISRLRNAASKDTNEQDKNKLAEFFNAPFAEEV